MVVRFFEFYLRLRLSASSRPRKSAMNALCSVSSSSTGIQYKGVRMITIYDNDLPGNGAGEKDWV